MDFWVIHMNLAADVCYRMSRRRVLRRQLGDVGAKSQSFSRSDYQDWRQHELEQQFLQHFSFDALETRDVLDFGCGGGELSLFAANHGAASVTSFEVDPDQHQLASNNLNTPSSTCAPIKLVLGEALDSIPFDDRSFDVVLCFDVLEHILEYRSIIGEWRRILRPGGRVLIWWVPYFHPYGHHVESLVPLPWVHALFSDKAIINACARIYDMPDFKPRVWDLDENGQKKPNKWRNLERLPTLNRLTISEFERTVHQQGLAVRRREFHPISSSKGAKAASMVLTKLPLVREFFTACTVYELSLKEGGRRLVN